MKKKIIKLNVYIGFIGTIFNAFWLCVGIESGSTETICLHVVTLLWSLAFYSLALAIYENLE